MIAHKLEVQFKTPEQEKRYREIATQSLDAIQKHAPVAYEELMGVAESGVVSLDEMLLMVSTYEGEAIILSEKYKEDPAQRQPVTQFGPCSGFAAIAKGGKTLVGQSSDEDPLSYLNGTLDFMIHYEGEQPGKGVDVMTYVHPGQLATMGFNSHGLAILWQLIDDGSRSEDYYGVPFTALVREALSKPTLKEAHDYLCSTPVAIPNNLILAQGNEFMDLEISPPVGCVSSGHFGNQRDKYLVHTNHIIYDLEMINGGDAFRTWTVNGTGKEGPNTLIRYRALQEGLSRVFEDGDFGVESMKEIYNDLPLYRNFTLATMFYDTSDRIWQIRFSNPWGQNPPRGFNYVSYSFDDATRPLKTE